MSEEQIVQEPDSSESVESVESSASPSVHESQSGDYNAALDEIYGESTQAESNDQSAQQSPASTSAAQTSAPQATGTKPVPQSPAQPEIPALTDEQRQLLSRSQFSERHLPTDPHDRNVLFANLKRLNDNASQQYRRAQQLEQQLQQVQQANQTAPQLPENEAKLIAELDGIDKDLGIGQRVSSLVQSAVNRTAQQYQQQIQQAAEQTQQMNLMLYHLHEEQGYSDIKEMLPATIKVDPSTPEGRANREKITVEALRWLNANYNPASFTMRHAVAKAAQALFHTDIQLAERSKLAESQARTRRGTPNPGRSPIQTKPGRTPDEAYDSTLDAIYDGEDDPVKLAAVAHGRG